MFSLSKAEQNRIELMICITVVSLISSILYTKEFADELKNLDFVKMLHSNAFVTIALVTLPAQFFLYDRYRRKHLNFELERNILIETILEKFEDVLRSAS